MTSPLHPDERAFYVMQLRGRVARLTRLLSVPVLPDSVLGMAIGGVLRAAIPLCSDAARADVFSWLGGQLREAAGLCPFCGAEKAAAAALMCPGCMAEAEADDRELLMLEANQGEPS